jgi:hypothetical protein
MCSIENDGMSLERTFDGLIDLVGRGSHGTRMCNYHPPPEWRP